jgi:hypothetical protein
MSKTSINIAHPTLWGFRKVGPQALRTFRKCRIVRSNRTVTVATIKRYLQVRFPEAA